MLGVSRNLLRMAAEEELPNLSQAKGLARGMNDEKKIEGVTAVKFGTFISLRNSSVSTRYITRPPRIPQKTLTLIIAVNI